MDIRTEEGQVKYRTLDIASGPFIYLVEKRDTGERRILEPGQALAETVETTHRGFTTDEPVELIVFYAGRSGLPLTINQE